MQHSRLTVEEQIKKLRLDDFLYAQIGFVSKMFLRALIEQNAVTVNGSPKPCGYHLQQNEVVELSFDHDAQTAMTPEDLSLNVVFEDGEIIVVNKPSGMLVHPTKHVKTGTLSNALAFHCNQSTAQHQQSKIIRPTLIHRLDKDTSGLLVAAKTARAARVLSEHFARKLVEKKYLAVVTGELKTDAGKIELPIARFDDEKPHWRVDANGKSAETDFRVITRRADSILLELTPITGRTNQLRIHCAFSGFPIVGDTIYGGSESARLCLHAARLSFYHPNGGRLEFTSDAPPEFDF